MRNALEHRAPPIWRGRPGKGKTLALSVGEHDMTIDDEKGTLTATHADVGGWVCSLHALAVIDPERWIRT